MKNLFNFRPLLFIALSLLLGISIGYFVFIGKTLSVIICFIIFIVLILALYFACFSNGLRYKTILSIVMVVFVLIGAISFTLRINNYVKNNLAGGRHYSVKGRIIDSTEYSNSSVYLVTDLEFVGAKSFTSNAKLKLVSYDRETPYRYNVGDIIAFNDNVLDCQVKYNGEFSAYNVVNNIKYSSGVSSSSIVVYLTIGPAIN